MARRSSFPKPGPEWLFLLAVVPLIAAPDLSGPREAPALNYGQDLLFLGLLIALFFSLRHSSESSHGLFGMAGFALLILMGLAFFRAPIEWSLVLIALWVVGLGVSFFQGRKDAFSAAAGFPKLFVISTLLSGAFLIFSGLFFERMSGRRYSAHLAVYPAIQLLGLTLCLGLAVARRQRGWVTGRTFARVASICLAMVLLSECRHYLGLLQGMNRVHNLEMEGRSRDARNVLGRLIGISEAKELHFLQARLALIGVRLDLLEQSPDRAVKGLLWVAERNPNRLHEVLGLLNEDLLGDMHDLPSGIRDEHWIFSDLEQARDGRLLLLDRWGRVFERFPGDNRMRCLYKEPMPGGRTAQDVEETASGGLLILDNTGALSVRGEIGSVLTSVLANYEPLPDSVNLELSSSGEGFYVLNAFGKVRTAGITRLREVDFQHRWDYRTARSLALTPDETGAIILDGRGGLHGVGRVPFDLRPSGAPYWPDDENRVADVEFTPTSEGAILLTKLGEWHTFGDAELLKKRNSFPTVSFAVDFEVSESGGILVLTPSGVVIESGDPNAEARNLLMLAAARVAAGDITRAWYAARDAVDLLPALREESLSLFEDVLFPLKTEDAPAGLFRSIAVHRGIPWVLDAWGQVFQWRNGSLEKTFSFDLPDGEWARGLLYVPEVNGPLVLTSGGRVLYSGILPEWLEDLCDPERDPIENAVDILVDFPRKTSYILDMYGGVHSFGPDPVGTPFERQALWETAEAVGMALVNQGAGLIRLDRLGGGHPVGDAGEKDTEWWGRPVAAAIVSDSSGTGYGKFSVYGGLMPNREWKETVSPYLFASGDDISLIDACYDPEARVFYLLRFRGEVERFPLGPEAADVWISRAECHLASGEISLAGDAFIRSVRVSPESAEMILNRLDGRSIGQLARKSPLSGKDRVSLVVDSAPGPEPGTLHLLDRFGRVLLWDRETYRVIEGAGAIRGEADAVAFSRDGDSWWVLFSDGVLTNGKTGRSFQFEWDIGMARDLLVLQPGGGVAMDSHGTLSVWGDIDPDRYRFPEARWDFPIARAVTRIGQDLYILDGSGGLHGPPDASADLIHGAVYREGLDVFRDFGLSADKKGFLTLDLSGRVFQTDGVETKIGDALLAPEVRDLSRRIDAFLFSVNRFWREHGLGIPRFKDDSFIPYEGAVSLVVDPRDDARYVVYSSGRIAPTWSRAEQAGWYEDSARRLWAEGRVEETLWEIDRNVCISGSSGVPGMVDDVILPVAKDIESPRFRLFQAVEPDGDTGNAFLLDRWGRIFHWSPESYPVPVHSEIVPQTPERGGLATAFKPLGSLGFVILTENGRLFVRGSVPETVRSLVDRSTPTLRSAIDLTFSPDGSRLHVATAFGPVYLLAESGYHRVSDPSLFWEEEVIVGMVSVPEGPLLLDRYGGLHPVGGWRRGWANVPYYPAPLLSAFAALRQGGLVLLRLDGLVRKAGEVEHPVWDDRFLPEPLRFVRSDFGGIMSRLDMELTPSVDISVDDSGTTTFVLRGNGEVIRYSRTSAAARWELSAAEKALAASVPLNAVSRVDRAFAQAPETAAAWLVESGHSLVSACHSAGIPDATAPPLFVDFIPSPKDKTLHLLLDRWGRLLAGPEQGFHLWKGATHSRVTGEPAVGADRIGETDRIAIGYRDGAVEIWDGVLIRRTIRIPLKEPDEAVSLRSSFEGVLFLCTALGKVFEVDPESGRTKPVVDLEWEFPLARGYEPESLSGGYLLEIFGSIHTIGRTNVFVRFVEGEPAPWWREPWARNLAFSREPLGLYMLDVFGGIHGFGRAISGERPRGLPYSEEPFAVKMRTYGNRIFLLTLDGGIHEGTLETWK